MSHFSVRRYQCWFTILGVAVAYFLAGKLSYFSIIPPGYDALIWPASGVALASVLLYGYRIWLGIFLGAFVVNGLIAAVSSQVSENLISLLITCVISVGATLQAIVGAYLVKRWAGFPERFLTGSQVFSFFLYGGAISVLLNPTLSISILIATGRTSTEHFLSQWLIWWTGDFLGILIFCPLVLVWLWPQPQGHTRRLVLTYTLVVMLLLTGGAVYTAKQHNYEELKSDFNLHAALMNVALEETIAAHFNALNSLGRLYSSSKQVDSDEFQRFVSHYFEDIKSIYALSWCPLVFDKERAVFEKNIRLQGDSQFKIKERDLNNKLVTAKQREFYTPITFVYPLKDRAIALGFDMYSDVKRRKAIDQARLSTEIAITDVVEFVQDNGHLRGVVAVMPIYKETNQRAILPEPLKNVSTYVAMVLLLDEMAPIAFKDLDVNGLSYRAIDLEAPSVDESLLFEKEWSLVEDVKQQQRYFGEDFTLKSTTHFKVANRVWQFEIAPTKAWLVEHGHGYEQAMLLLGLVLTGVTGIFIWVVSGRDILLAHQRLDKVRQSQYIAHLDRQRSLGALSASLGHELNQPLAAIMINTQVAKRSLQKELSLEFLEALLDKIIYNTRRTHLIIDKIRAFIQPSQLERMPVDINTLVKETLGFLTQDMMMAGVEARFTLTDTPMFVKGDALQLSQVLLNIYRNAIDALQHEQHRNIYIAVTQLDSWIVITIRDNGPGLTNEALQQVTTPFYTTKTSGLGLGLAISKDIIEQHQGQLVISNTDEGGACFEVKLPMLSG